MDPSKHAIPSELPDRDSKHGLEAEDTENSNSTQAEEEREATLQVESDRARFIAKYGPILEENHISSELITKLAEGNVAWTDVSQPEQEIIVDTLGTTPDQLHFQQLADIAATFEVRAQRTTIEENRPILA